jgi:hypothetical protein
MEENGEWLVGHRYLAQKSPFALILGSGDNARGGQAASRFLVRR